MDGKFSSVKFQDVDRESGHILSLWLERSGVKPGTILEELKEAGNTQDEIGQIGAKTFGQWVSDVVSTKQISGPTPELRGNRVVTLVRWFVREHQHRIQPVVKVEELERFISLYHNIPVKNRLQLMRIYHELKIHEEIIQPRALFEIGNWRQQFTDWPVFGFVVDDLMCVRASNILDMEFVGLDEEDVKHWDWWHRLTARVSRTTKYNSSSPFHSLRGQYSETYYRYQMTRFIAVADERCSRGDQRCLTLLALLKRSTGFSEMWEQCKSQPGPNPSDAFGIPIPFFRKDGTLVWMFEVSILIPGTDNYHLVVWLPADEDAIEYTAEIRRLAYTPGRYSKKTFFVDDYTQHFSQEERIALGLA